jgi:hypothetical protein
MQGCELISGIKIIVIAGAKIVYEKAEVLKSPMLVKCAPW